MTVDVAVIGGGISGLATAYELMRLGHRVAVLERQVRPGGNAVSERIGGFLMEHGPSSVNTAPPVAAELARSLGLEGLRCGLGPSVCHRYLVRDGRLHGISVHPLGLLLSGYLSLPARLRMLAEVLVPAGETRDEETVAGFWRRRFGSEFVDRVVDPLVGGLFAASAGEVSMPAVFPALLDLERKYGSITRGMLKRRRAGGAMPGRRLFSWRDGLGTLPTTLAARLGPAVKTGVVVRRIRPLSRGFRVEAMGREALEARAVVLAVQPHVAAELLDGVDTAAAEAAAAIDAPPLAVVFLGYARRRLAHPLEGLGYLVPASEGRSLTGALFCSTMFPGRAPDGHVAVAGYVGGSRAPDLARLAPADLVALARAEFGELLGARGDPAVARVRQWPRGLPLYRLGHRRRVAALHGTEDRRAGLFVTGNYFAGPSVAACVAQAIATAARVHGHLLGRARPSGLAAEAGGAGEQATWIASVRDATLSGQR